MTRVKPFLSLLLVLPFLFIILAVQLNLSTDVQAKPLAGFTPTPIPAPHGGGSRDNDEDDPPPQDPPADYVLVQIDRCDLHCGGLAQAGDQPDFQPLASIASTEATDPLLIPMPNPQALPELLTPVRLVHDGSAFIVEGELSDRNPTRFAVPYPGRWQVWLTGSPRFMTAQIMDVSGSNMADLQIQLANGPVSLGWVEANTPGPQMVKCPLACVIDPPPAAEAPPHLPQTGGQLEAAMSYSTFLIKGTLTLSLIGLMLWAACRYPLKNERS